MFDEKNDTYNENHPAEVLAGWSDVTPLRTAASNTQLEKVVKWVEKFIRKPKYKTRNPLAPAAT